MDKKPLIEVSLCAVVLLVMGSLSNVVGYQSVKSTVNHSPLFKTRILRVICSGSNSNTLSSKYLGKGFTKFLFPLKDSEEECIKKYIERIRAMDENNFHRFISYTVNQIKQKDTLKDINIKEFIKGLNQLRKSKQNIIVYNDGNDDRRTWFRPNFYPTSCWIPGCLILSIIFIIIILINLGPTLYPIPCGL
jgi:hypothetical protein